MKKIASLVFASVLGGGLALGGYLAFVDASQQTQIIPKDANIPQVLQTKYIPASTYTAEATDFTKAAEETVNAVVHVKNQAITRSNPLADLFYGRQSHTGKKATVGAGSGVIISPDGYIITNNHVIKGAEGIEITLNNKKTYTAEVVGTHERSDIALLKIDASNLPYITFANSDNVKVGEWVLAVGNPFNLTSTVTAGIISAKGRDIHLANNNKIESFIQTDAAVNPGNSGGALVNVRGELVGINTAITSQTGSYVGYSFAVPSNIAKKVIEDIMEFGDVQTAYIGISFDELDSKAAKELDLNVTEGVLITSLTENGGAKAAGLKVNDIITKLDNVEISKFSDMQGFLSAKRPGDLVDVTFIRNGGEKNLEVKLANQFGKENVGKFDFTNLHMGELKLLSKNKASKFKINYGIEFLNIKSRDLIRQKIKNGDIILKINETKVYSLDDVEEMLRKNKGKIVILQVLNDEGYAEYPKIYVQN